MWISWTKGFLDSCNDGEESREELGGGERIEEVGLEKEEGRPNLNKQQLRIQLQKHLTNASKSNGW